MKVLVAIGGMLDCERIIGVYSDTNVEAAQTACEAHAASAWDATEPLMWEMVGPDEWGILWSGYVGNIEYNLELHELAT